MEEKVFVIGHKNPDTDSIASALAYADLKRKLGMNAEARRLGTLNEETKFATRKFEIEAPMLISDARSQLLDLNIDEPVLINKDISCNEAYKKIIKTKSKTLFVADENKCLLGIVSVSDLSNLRMNTYKQRISLMKHTNLEIIASDLTGNIVVKPAKFKCNGVVNIIAYGSSDQIKKNVLNSICIVLNDESIQKEIIEHGASCLILGLKSKPSKYIQNLAKEKGVAIITSPMIPMEIARIIYESVPVSHIMTKDVVCYLDTDFVEDVAVQIANTRYRSYPVINEDRLILGSISRYHLFKYKKKNFILVDHSSKVQSIDYLDKAEIVEIVDHHHIGDVQTSKPIFYRNQKCGCTSSIIYQLYRENGLVPERKIAGMMLSAIISDTLYFQSETTIKSDIEIAKELAKLAEVDLDKYAKELLESSVNLKDGNVKEILGRDLKRYNFGKHYVAVGQTNYSNLEDLQTRLKEFEVEMKEEQEKNKYDLIVMMFTHVLAEGTMFLFFGPSSDVMFNIISAKFSENSGYDYKIMSRKQQLIPMLSEELSEN